MPTPLSVIICTHNPRREYLLRSLLALREQTLPKNQWDLLVVDNSSEPPLADVINISWHPRGRLVVESELGILPARVRGIKEAKTDFLLFVDDDNLLEPDYLAQSLAIAEEFPFLGVWGGSISPEFESPPPPWIAEFHSLLACVAVPEDRWSNLRFTHATTPPTAGMCLRRVVADEFVRVVEVDSRRQFLGRRGKSGLTNGEDTDLALTACDMGLGTGQFSRLKMTHLIPRDRLDESYLIRFAEGTYYSGLILEALRGRRPEEYSVSPLRAILGKLRRRLLWSRRRRGLFEGQLRARKRACEVVANWE